MPTSFLAQQETFRQDLDLDYISAKIPSVCRSGGMVDARDSKSRDSDIMSVRVRPSVPNLLIFSFSNL